MKREKNPFEQVLAQLADMVTYITEKGYKPVEGEIPEDLLSKVSALQLIVNQLRKNFDEQLDKAGHGDLVAPAGKAMEDLNPRQKKFFQQLEALKNEILMKKRHLEVAVKAGKKKAATSDKPSKKKKGKKRIKKFRGIGGTGWQKA